MKLPSQKGFSHLTLAIILGIFPLLLFAFVFDAHAESTSETPRQLCDDARRDGSYTILEDTQDKCTYVLPGVIKHEHFYQGNQLCYRGTGYDVMTGELRGDTVSTECFDRVYPGQAEEVTKPAPTQKVVKQPPPKPTVTPPINLDNTMQKIFSLQKLIEAARTKKDGKLTTSLEQEQKKHLRLLSDNRNYVEEELAQKLSAKVSAQGTLAENIANYLNVGSRVSILETKKRLETALEKFKELQQTIEAMDKAKDEGRGEDYEIHKQIYLDQRLYLKAIFGRVILDTPSNFEANFALGHLYASEGNSDAAWVFYTRALSNTKSEDFDKIINAIANPSFKTISNQTKIYGPEADDARDLVGAVASVRKSSFVQRVDSELNDMVSGLSTTLQKKVKTSVAGGYFLSLSGKFSDLLFPDLAEETNKYRFHFISNPK